MLSAFDADAWELLHDWLLPYRIIFAGAVDFVGAPSLAFCGHAVDALEVSGVRGSLRARAGVAGAWIAPTNPAPSHRGCWGSGVGIIIESIDSGALPEVLSR